MSKRNYLVLKTNTNILQYESSPGVAVTAMPNFKTSLLLYHGIDYIQRNFMIPPPFLEICYFHTPLSLSKLFGFIFITCVMARSPEISLVVGKNVTAYGWGSEELNETASIVPPTSWCMLWCHHCFHSVSTSTSKPLLFLLFILNLCPLF